MAISITIEPSNTVVTANLALADSSSANVAITPTGAVTATTLQGAIEQLAAQDFRSNEAPSGSNVDVGDTWYDTNDNIFYVYRTIDGVTDWVPLQTSANADETDGGSF